MNIGDNLETEIPATQVGQLEGTAYINPRVFFGNTDVPELDWDQALDDIKFPDYVFEEDSYVAEALDHINRTYETHYGEDSIQATEVIIDAGHGTGFNIGNIIKYAKRYGKKDGYNRNDILKIIHYAVMQLHVHDKEDLS